MATCGQRERVAVSWSGKAKTMMQMIALTLLLYHQPILGWDTEQMGMISLYFAAFLTFWSVWEYLRVALPTLWSQSGVSQGKGVTCCGKTHRFCHKKGRKSACTWDK